MKKILLFSEWLSGTVFLLFLWWLCSDWMHWINPFLLPPLESILPKLQKLVFAGIILPDLQATCYRWAAGFFLGTLSGLLIGLVLGISPRIYRAFELPIEFFRAMPVTAIFPLYLVFLGIGDESKIAMAFTPTFLLMLINAAYGVSHSPHSRQHMAKVFGATHWQIFRKIIFFDALPQIFIGLRHAVSLSLIVTVVSEMFIGTELGLGQRVYDSYLTNQTPTLYALLILLGIMGYLMNKLVITIEKKFIFWAGRS